MRTVEIPGGTAQLRERPDIKVRHRRVVEAAGTAAVRVIEKIRQAYPDLQPGDEIDPTRLDLSARETELMMELQDATLVALLASWSRDEPLPTMETVGDMDPDVYDALAAQTRVEGAELATPTSFEPSDPRAPGFEQTPTGPSGGSAPALRAIEGAQSTSASSDTGASTGTAPSSVA